MSITDRVEKLLSQMTLEEKIAQTDMIRGVTLATKVHPAHFCSVDPTSDFYWDRVDTFIGEKGIGFVHDVYSVPAVLNRLQKYMVEKTRLGIPCIFTGEALHGLNYPSACVFPMPIALGAAFDPELTREVGRAIGEECRSLGIHEILAPNLDVARDPRWGRMEETFGEDTFLSSCMAEAIISGEQKGDISREDSVVCEPKHYLAHGFPEGGLNCASARAGEREILSQYLPVFEAGVQKGGACNIMASYNNIDGMPMICSRRYLTRIMKEHLGLEGYIRSDFGAVNRLREMHHMTTDDADSMVLAIQAGLDVSGFDFTGAYWQQTYVRLVQEGRIPMDVLDNAVRRILRIKFELGLFEHPYTDEKRYQKIVRNDSHIQTALRAASESMTLLKNNGVLPISKDISSIAVIGPSSSRQRIGSYSSVPYGYTVPSVYEELKKLLPDVQIFQEEGCGISENDRQLIPAAWFNTGVHMTYYKDHDFTKAPVGTDTLPQLNFNWGLTVPHPSLPESGYAVRMEGTFTVDTSLLSLPEVLEGTLHVPGKEQVRLWIDGSLLLESMNLSNTGDTGNAGDTGNTGNTDDTGNTGDTGNTDNIDDTGDAGNTDKTGDLSCPFTFRQGETHSFCMEYGNIGDGWDVSLSFTAYNQNSFSHALELAKACDLTVLVCGDDTVTSGEGMDRCDIQLYGAQRELIRQAAAVARKTVLVLEIGKAVDLSMESTCMDAILVPWFGGELGARAIAMALTGDLNPSGHLPVSFPRNIGMLPCYYTLLPGGSTAYLEGDRQALYPFGHGLSYSTFSLENLSATVTGKDAAHVELQVVNTSTIPGTAVVFLFVEDPVSSVVTPDKRLCAFQRVPLASLETKQVSFDLGFDAFRLMNEDLQWVVEPGQFLLHAGFSSTDIRIKASITL